MRYVVIRASDCRYESLVPPMLFVTLASINPWWEGSWAYFDEGVNLMKAALIANGFSLYSDIWSDQPPFLTFILGTTERLFPRNIAVARAVILAFSALLLWSLFRTVYRMEGRYSAWVAVTALMATNAFHWQSVSVMVGLPAIALASAALDQTTAGAADNKTWRLWLAGLLYALSLQTKLFTGIIFPALILSVLLQEDSRLEYRGKFFKLSQLIFSLTLSFFFIAAVTREPIITQLIEPHFNVNVATWFGDQGGPYRLWGYVRSEGSVAVLILFGIGTFVCFRGREKTWLIPMVWLISGTLVLAMHRPLWSHHILILYLPIAWIAGLSIRVLEDKKTRKFIASASSAVFLLITIRDLERLSFLDASRYPPISLPQSPSQELWIMTDDPMEAYLSGGLVPPELAVWSNKRSAGGYLPAAFLIDVVEKRHPDQIILRRSIHPHEFLDFLDSTYERVGSKAGVRHYVAREFIAR